MSRKFYTVSALALMSALTLSACNETGRDTITASLGSAVQFNKNCQIVNSAAPAGCKRSPEVAQQADEAVVGYQETAKSTSTLRVKSASTTGSSGGSAQ